MRVLLLGLSLFCLINSSVSAAEKPNVVLFLIDDLGQRDLGCYGSKFYRTPNIDKLAKQGVQFSNGYASCPVCSPTRAAILTGKHPARLHLTDWLPGRGDRSDQKLNRPKINQQLPLAEITIAEELKKHGYATCHVGKWHLGGAGFDPTKQGFDVNIAGDQTGTPRSYFAPFENKSGKMPALQQAEKGEYLTDRLTKEATKFIDQNKDKPFFLYMAHYAVHTPLTAKKEYIEKYKSDGKIATQNNPIYAAMIESVDDSVGAVMDKLQELKLAENTIIIFTSDNGGLATREGPNTPATINTPLREGKGWLYEGGVRVPYIIKAPGIKKNDLPISSIDLFPTILGLCNIKCEIQFDGENLAPLLLQDNAKRNAEFYWHYPHYANQGGPPGAAIRYGNFKLIEYFADGRTELFDLDADIRESQNVIEKYPEVAADLRKKLHSWQEKVNAQKTTLNPDYHPNPQAKNGNVTLHARTASVHGIQLRYEPLPHKSTLGYWTNKDDYATWEFEIAEPGTFDVTVFQGCGNTSAGAEVEISVGSSKTTFIVKATGGFQAFENVAAGQIKIAEKGRHTLTVKVLKKPKFAVMDVRQITLSPAKK